MSTEQIDGLSIGALARATGINIHSLRMWERRYGAPASFRRPSGHRRYPYSEVARLRAVARALELGHRVGEVASLPIEKLEERIALSEQATESRRGAGAGRSGAHGRIISNWVAAARNFDEGPLSLEFMDEWHRLGPLSFLEERAVPLLRELGECWESGFLDVAQEHFAAEKMMDFLAARWRRMNEDATFAPVVIAGLPRDRHRAALVMVAVVAAAAGCRVVFLGPETPVDDLVRTSRQVNPVAVCLSASSVVQARAVGQYLSELRAAIADSIAVICGGGGAPREMRGVIGMDSFRALYDWLLEHRRRPA
jgi:DNA-binding transcriptional MerR regulator/methanogenic corrinoid protein MtbC1